MPVTVPTTRRTRARQAVAGLAAAVATIGMGACSSPAPSEPDISAALVDSGFSKEVADCAAEALTDSLTSNELAELAERGGGGAPVDDPKRDDDSYDELQKAMATCRELQAADAPTTTGPPSTGSDPSTPDTIADGTSGAELNPASTTTTAG